MTKMIAIDERRDLIIPGDLTTTINYCIDHFIETANLAIDDHGYFAVALSGGTTPKSIYEGMCGPEYRQSVDWSRVLLFWSDERCVPPDHADSNYHMAMQAGLDSLPIAIDNIFRMKGEEDPKKAAKEYQNIIKDKLNGAPFDMVMLGMGNDGHTASLFPQTDALHVGEDQWVEANFIPKLDAWRLTLTFPFINRADEITIYVLGHSKADLVKKIFTDPYDPDLLPVQKVGTLLNRASWILDDESAAKLL